jgi:hypothetical protein
MAHSGKSIETFGGLGLMGLGLFFLADEFLSINLTGTIWPLVVIGLGVYLLVGKKRAGGGGQP